LIKIGTRKYIAKVLVFLTKTPEATSHTIERDTGLRQPEVSLAMGYLMDQGWIISRECKGELRGRPTKMFTLVKPINEILDYFENEKKIEAGNQLGLMQKLRICIDGSYDKLAISLTPFSIFIYSIFSLEEMSLIFAF
jgi:predicted transcriptional regulator